MRKSIYFLTFVFSVLLFAACGSDTSTPKAAAENWGNMMKAGDYKGIVDQIAFPDEMSAEEKEQSKQMFLSLFEEKAKAQVEKKGGITSTEVVSETVAEDGKTAKVEMKITYGDGSVDDETVELVNVDGEWKLSIDK